MNFEEVARLAQQRGFFFRSADSYSNAPAGFWDYGPMGVATRNNLVELWRRTFVRKEGMLEIDGALILPRPVFEASGHLSSFTDPFVRCSNCGSVFRPDKLVEEKTGKQVAEKLADAEYDELMTKAGVKCLKCGAKLSGTSRFNMMFRVGVGPQQDEAYLRPETTQSIYVDFPLLYKTQRVKLPFGIAQVGKAFRNEIAPRQGLIRLRELNQAEVEILFNPKKTDSKRFATASDQVLNFELPDRKPKQVSVKEAISDGAIPNPLVGYYLARAQSFYMQAGFSQQSIRFRILSDEDRAFYSLAAFDLEVKLSVGWLELVACNYRGDYDLSRHAKVSGTSFTVDDEGEKVVPHIFELSMGIDRSLYSIIENSLKTDGERRLLSLRPYLSPVKVAVFPLVNKDGLPEAAAKLNVELSDDVATYYDDSGSIGRRYARADEAGVPFCITLDYDSLKDGTVTLRERDSREQKRVKMSGVRDVVLERTAFPGLSS